MPKKSSKSPSFWQELKRRDVFRVVAMYAGSAFIMIQVVDILSGQLDLPSWIGKLVIILLAVGFPVVVVLAWIFDLTPKGIKKTEPLEESEVKVITTFPGRRRLKTSDIIIGILAVAVVILVWPKIFNPNTIERLRSSGKRITLVVMPFKNLTNDTTWNIYQLGIQDNIINYLSNFTEDLTVRQTGSTNTLIKSKGLTNYAEITSSLAGTISQKLEANILIEGSIVKSGENVRVNAQLSDPATGDFLKSFQIEGAADNLLRIIDSVSLNIKDYLIISKDKKILPTGLKGIIGSPSSSEAFRKYCEARMAYIKPDYQTAMQLYLQALDIDSTLIDAARELSITYLNLGQYENARKWCLKFNSKKDQLSAKGKVVADLTHAQIFETPYEVIKYTKQFLEFDDQSPTAHETLGFYYNSLFQYDKAILEYNKSLEIFKNWQAKPLWIYNYTYLGFSYHKTGQYKKERKIYRKAELEFPDNFILTQRQAILALSEGDSVEAEKYLAKYESLLKESSWTEANIAWGLAKIFEEAGLLNKAEDFYRKRISFYPDNMLIQVELAYFLIDHDRNVNEGMELVDSALKILPDNYRFLDTKGWGLYKQGKYKEAFDVLQNSWNLRMKNALYDHEAFLHLEAAKKAVANQKNN